MAEVKFYYDELMNEDLTTFSVYWYKDETIQNRVDRSPTAVTGTTGNISEILRGVISQDASMGSQIVWNGSPLNLSSAWANIALNLKSTSRNLYNVANNAGNAFEVVNSMTEGAILNWDQDAYYSINEFQKTFGGITTSTPLSVSAIILPYINSSGIYTDVVTQLDTFLKCIYPDEVQEDSDNPTAEGQDRQLKGREIIKRSFESKDSEGKKKSVWEWLIGGAVGLLQGGLTWASGFLDRFTESVFQDTSRYVLRLKPPHGYSGVPIDFVEDKWMANTLALRIGPRQLFNLLISTVNITVSKELTIRSDAISPSRAQVDLTFQPVTILKPTEIKNYVLSDLNSKTGGK